MPIETLYKYGRLDPSSPELLARSETLFATPNVWFSAPATLNDPFECRPWFTFDGTREEIVRAVARGIRGQDPRIPPNEAVAQATGIFLEGRHRNPATWEALRLDVLRMLGNRIGMCCLSAVPDDVLMWSHYGFQHTGYCMGFEATDHTPFFGTAQLVNYRDEFPHVDFFNTPHDKQVDLIFLTKYSGWKYEAEYRIIDHDNGPGLHSYPTELLRTVIFGLRMPEAERELIRAWVHRRGHAVDFFETTIHDKAYKVEIRPLPA